MRKIITLLSLLLVFGGQCLLAQGQWHEIWLGNSNQLNTECIRNINGRIFVGIAPGPVNGSWSSRDGVTWQVEFVNGTYMTDVVYHAATRKYFASNAYGANSRTLTGSNWSLLRYPYNFQNDGGRSIISKGNTIIVALWFELPIFSFNNGTSWDTINATGYHERFRSFALHGDTLLAGTSAGRVAISTDNGHRWHAGGQMPYLSRYGALSVNDVKTFNGKVLAATDSGLMVSTDNRASWQRVRQGLSAIKSARCFVSSDSVLYMGTNKGIYLSRNQGQSWVRHLPLIDEQVQALALKGDTLFAGFPGDFSYMKLGRVTATRSAVARHDVAVWPSPATRHGTIYISCPEKMDDARLITMDGKQIQLLERKDMDSGFSMKVDAPPGTYFLHAVVNGTPVRQRIMLVE